MISTCAVKLGPVIFRRRFRFSREWRLREAKRQKKKLWEKKETKGGEGERVGARDLQGAISDEWASVRATKKNRNERS